MTEGPPKVGIDDLLAALGEAGPTAVWKIIEAAKPAEAPARKIPDDGRPHVLIEADEYVVTDLVVKHLSDDPDLFQRGQEFVRVATDPSVGTPTISRITQPEIRYRATKYMRFVRMVKGGEGDEGELALAHPPEWACLQAMHHPDKPGIRELCGISAVPILRLDGSVHDSAGYDEKTRTYYAPGKLAFRPLPDVITQADAQAAAARLLDLVCDFPFETAAGRSVWLSYVISPIVRHLITGGVPIHAFDANIRGSGKGLLVACGCLISMGVEIPCQPYSTDPDEMRKLITSYVRSGKQVVNLDNIESGTRFGSPILDSAITSEMWEDRILGQNVTTVNPHRIVWALSGNNISYKDDTARRIVRSRIESSLSNPEDRGGFKYPHLTSHITSNRGEYVRDAIAIVAGYLRAGRPRTELPPAGSFDGWTEIVRRSLVWAGCLDPWITNLSAREELDTESGELSALIDAWEELDTDGKGLTTAEAKRRAVDVYSDTPRTAEFLTLIGAREFDTNWIGKILRKHKGRVAPDGKRITGKPAKGGATRWRVESIPTITTQDGSNRPSGQKQGEDGEDGEDVSSPTRERSEFQVYGPNTTAGGATAAEGNEPNHPHHPNPRHPAGASTATAPLTFLEDDSPLDGGAF